MTERLDLPDRYREQIEALLREHLPEVEAWAYGSRLNGQSHPGSDLDLVLRSPTLEPVPGDRYVEFVKAVEQSNIPILVQAHDWAKLPESFHQEIARDYYSITCNWSYIVYYSRRLENSEGGVLMAPRYRVTLTAEERAELKALTRAATKTTGKRFLYSRALLLCDRGSDRPGWTVARVAEALGVSTRTVERLKRRFVEQGLEFALERKRRVRPPREVIFDGVFEARLVALACSQAPPGRKRWTLRLLAEKVVELGWVERVSVMTVQRTLKKTNCSLIGRSIGGSRPGAAPHS